MVCAPIRATASFSVIGSRVMASLFRLKEFCRFDHVIRTIRHPQKEILRFAHMVFVHGCLSLQCTNYDCFQSDEKLSRLTDFQHQ